MRTTRAVNDNHVHMTLARPWGDTGTDIKTKFVPVIDVMKQSGMDWTVSLRDVFLENGKKIPNVKATVRDSDDKPLGLVGKRFTVLQNVDAFGLMNSFVDQRLASITTVGSFKGGSVLFLQAEVEIDPVEIIKDYPLKSFITLGHAHDGSLKVQFGFTPVNMFCMNQMPMLKRSSSTRLLSMKHTKNMQVGLEAIKGIMDIHTAEFHATADQYQFLASKGINKKSLEKYVTMVLSKGKGDERDMDKVIEPIMHLFETGIGLGAKNMHNYYGAFNAITEHLTWHVGRTEENRLKSLWFGEAQHLSQRALDVATQLAGGRA